MNKVYVVHHVRSDDEYGENAKLIGVYRSKEAADNAAARLKDKPGFCDSPDGFHFDLYELDKDHWTEGFGQISN